MSVLLMFFIQRDHCDISSGFSGFLFSKLPADLGVDRRFPNLNLAVVTHARSLIITSIVDVPELLTVVLALSLVGGAYLAHSVYAGISSLPPGQMQAALALGMTRWQAMRRVVLPQALPMMLPSFVNQWIALIKDTSLAYVIGVGELSFVATQVNNRVMVYPAEIFLAVAVLYYLMCASLDVASGWLLKRQPARAWHEPQAG